MNGEGSYTYKKTGDIYSGSWKDNKKHGLGRYEYAKDKSMLVGQWEEGQLVSGSWELKGAGVYDGQFKLGRPFGAGKFSFASGLTQQGEYVKIKSPDEEEPAEGEAPKTINVEWSGKSIVTF